MAFEGGAWEAVGSTRSRRRSGCSGARNVNVEAVGMVGAGIVSFGLKHYKASAELVKVHLMTVTWLSGILRINAGPNVSRWMNFGGLNGFSTDATSSTFSGAVIH